MNSQLRHIDHIILYTADIAEFSRSVLVVEPGPEKPGRIEQFNAVPAKFTAKFDTIVEIGSIWTYDIYNFIVTQPISAMAPRFLYTVECETGGAASSSVIQRALNNGTPVNITPVSDAPLGLTSAEITAVTIEGEDEKTDEQIRETYYEYVNNSASDGNVAQYRRWCEEYEGIGAYKITPLWDDHPNSVKIAILTASNRAVNTSSEPNLVTEFQEYLDPGVTGMGDGVAPIGAFVTVVTGTELSINVSATVTWAGGYEHDADALDAAVTAFLSEIAYKKSKVAYMSLGAAINAVEGVDFISSLLINSGTAGRQSVS